MVRGSASAVLGVVLAAAASGCASAHPRGLTVVPGAFVPGTQPDGNSVVLEGAKGLIVVDTGRHPAHTQAVLDQAQTAGKPIVAVINTHWHLDHVGGNPMVRARYPGVRVYASNAIQAARQGFLANYRKQLQEMIAKTSDADEQKTYRAEIALIDAGPQLAPDVVIASTGKRRVAGRTLEIHLEGPAATAGDLWIRDPATRMVISGDLVTLPAPFLDTACPAGWQAALGRIAAVDFVELVPGHGAPMTHAAFDSYRTAFDHLLACAATPAEKAACTDGWLKDLGPLVPAADEKFTRSLMDYYVDVLRGDPARTAKLCAA